MNPIIDHNYYGEDRVQIVETLAANYDVIVAMSLRGVRATVIGCGLGVSRETIQLRLRPLRLSGRRGKPRLNVSY